MRFTTKLANIFVKPAVFAIIFSLVLTGCALPGGQRSEKTSKTALLLNTVVTITVYEAEDAALIDGCLEMCERYEKVFSRTDPESELYKLNESGGMVVSDELLEVLQEALFWCEKTGGAFDITLGAVSDMYGFGGQEPRVPTESELSEALRHTGYEKISVDGNTVTHGDSEAVIDLGAIAKGYIADRLADYLTENDCGSAIINLGGNILCVGEKPDGSAFNVGIQYPFEDSQKTITNVAVRDMSVVTSGIYERSFEDGGVLYHHILSPETGLPCDGGLLAVSIVGPDSAKCDALSTVCFAIGIDEGIALVNSLDGYECVFVDAEYALHSSAGFDNLLS